MEYEFSRQVRIEHIDRKGKVEDVSANAEECESLAARLNVLSVDALQAHIKAERMNDRVTYHLQGTVSGKVTQESVISGELIQTNINQDIDAWFSDNEHIKSFELEKQKRDRDNEDEEYEIKDEKDDPETIIGGVIDFGEVAIQFFALGIEDYPKSDAEKKGENDYIEVKEEDIKPNPFAKLAELKTKE